jgi:hypothetical protein
VTEPAAIVELRRVLQVAAPDADADEIDRRAREIAAYAAMIGAGRVAAARRGTAPGSKALDALYGRIDGVIDLIDKLQPDAQIALRRRPGAPALADMTRVLWEWNEHVLAARAQLGLSADEPTRKGRGRKDEAKHIARYCGAAFTALTGKKAAITNRERQPAHGPFLDMVRGVFAALGIEASAEAALTGKPMEKTRPPKAL